MHEQGDKEKLALRTRHALLVDLNLDDVFLTHFFAVLLNDAGWKCSPFYAKSDLKLARRSSTIAYHNSEHVRFGSA